MMSIKIKKNILQTFALIFIISLFFTLEVKASEKCSFTRDIEVGDVGNDVKCLQKYLNSSGYVISSSGIGSPGNETNVFKELTRTALIKWQIANGISPAKGYFGAVSRQAYNRLTAGTSASVSSSPTTVVIPGFDNFTEEEKAIIRALQGSSNSGSATVANSNSAATPAPVVSSAVTQKSVQTLILKAIDQIEEAQDEIDDSKESESVIKNANGDLDDARESFMDAIVAYFDNDLAEAKKLADKSFSDAEDAYKRVGGETDEDKTETRLDEVDDKIDSIRDKIEEAEDNDKEVDESNDLIDEATDLFEQAEQAFEDGDYDEAEDLADEAEDTADDAEDAIGEVSDEKEDADDAIADAKSAINKARNDIQEADDNDEDIGDADDLLDESDDLLDEARDYYDDEDYENALKYARKAETKAEDAQDAL